MHYAVIAAIFSVISVAIVVRLRECHVNVNEFFQELEESSVGTIAVKQPMSLEITPPTNPLPADIMFTESLLALSKVGLRVPDDSPVHEPAESSLLVSVHPARSKSPGLAL